MKPRSVLPWNHSSVKTLFCLIVGASLIATGCQGLKPPVATPVASTAPQPLPEPTGTTGPATSVASPQPTDLATALASAQPTGVATALPSGAHPFFLGTIYVQNDPQYALFGAPFTGIFTRLMKPENAIAQLNAVRAKGIQVFINMASKRQQYQEADGAFSVAKYNAILDGFRDIDFAPYVADGTVLGNILVDEPQDPTNWNGKPMPYADLEAVAAHSKQLWPTVPVGAYGPPSFLQAGAVPSVEFGVAQYTTKKGEFNTWLAQEEDAARQGKLGLILGLEALVGAAKNQRMSPDQIKQWGEQMLKDPNVCAMLFIRYDPGLMSDPATIPVLADLGQLARQRTAKSCQVAH